MELPARGVGADTIGRASALLVDIGIDTVPRGYRIAAGRSAVTRRAASLLDEDIDALEEAWETAGLRGGTADGEGASARADHTGRAAGTARRPPRHHRFRCVTRPGRVAGRRCGRPSGGGGPAAVHPVVVQFDEPSLPAALEGRLTGVTSLTPVHPVDESMAIGLLDDCVSAVGADVVLHSCASGLSWKMLQRSTIHAVSIDVSTLTAADLDGVGEFVDSGRTVMLGVVPSTSPARPTSAEEIAKSAVAVNDRLGFARSVLRERIGITPACGLAGATQEWARTAIELTQKAVDAIAEDPDAI